jgi:transposase
MQDKRGYPKPYPEAFRREAIEVVRSGGGSTRQIASDLGICHETLRHYLKQAEIDTGKRDGLTTDERSELRELRRRVRTLEQECEIFGEAAVFFARESETR